MLAAMVGIPAQPAWAPDAFTDGLGLFNAGEWTRAASQLVSAASRRPNDVVFRLTAGVALASVKRYPEAAAQFRAAARVGPGGILPQLLLDGVYAEMGNQLESRRSRDQAGRIVVEGLAFGAPNSSDQALARSLDKYPQNAIAHLLLGDLYQLQDKLGPAKQQYSKASELAPKWVKPVFNLGMADLQANPKEAEQRFTQAIQMDPSNRRAYLWQGDAYLGQNKFGKAIEYYNYAAKDKKLAAEAQTRIGNAQLRAGNYRAAEEGFSQAAKQAPQDARPIAGQAQVFQNEGKYKQAEEKYNQAAGVLAQNKAPAPSQAVVKGQIAEVQVQQGRFEDAITNLKLGYELHPTEGNAETLVIAQGKSGRLQEGISENEAALAKNPRNVHAMVYLLSAYKATGNQLSRIDTANRLIRADPGNAPAHYADLGAAQMAVGNVADGVEAYVRALESGGPTTWADTARSAASAGALGQVRDRVEKAFKASNKLRTGLILFDIHSIRKDAQGMIATAETLIKLSPDQPTCWLRLGEAYEQAGSKDLALTAYSEAAAGSDPEAASAARSRIEAIK